MILIFDTETTGLPLSWSRPFSDVDNWPRLVQIAWLEMEDASQTMPTLVCHLICPDGFEIPKKAQLIHGITTEKAAKEGKPVQDVLGKFCAAVARAEMLVGHNVAYDRAVVGAELCRVSATKCLLALVGIRSACTMEIGKNLCQIPGAHGWKWPTLAELYFELFRRPRIREHQADADVLATAEIFCKLRKRGMVTCERIRQHNFG